MKTFDPERYPLHRSEATSSEAIAKKLTLLSRVLLLGCPAGAVLVSLLLLTDRRATTGSPTFLSMVFNSAMLGVIGWSACIILRNALNYLAERRRIALDIEENTRASAMAQQEILKHVKKP